jgi:hypothetical protein
MEPTQKSTIQHFYHQPSQLKKKIHACAYHRIREMITGRAVRFLHCQSALNVADVLTKPLGGILHRRLIEPILCGNGVLELFTAGNDGN